MDCNQAGKRYSHRNKCCKKKTFARKAWLSYREGADFFLFCEPDNLEQMKALGGHSGHRLVI